MTATSGDGDALRLSGITKRFGTVVALDDASLRVRPRTVHALLGENGAGKTTLMRVAFGLSAPDGGSISVFGKPHRFRSAADAIDAGLGMVHQHFTNVPAMTVAENVSLGDRGLLRESTARKRVREIGERTGLRLAPDARVEDLSVGAQQRLEIVKALARNARVLILDEPTAVLSPSEAEELMRWARGFADEGNAVVLITHKLREALSVADDVTVLRRGKCVLSGASKPLTEDALAAAMLGESRDSTSLNEQAATARPAQSRAETPSRVVVQIRDVRLTDHGVQRLNDVSFDVMAGEIVGIAAIEGAGQHELLRVLARRRAPESGDVKLPDSIGFIPEDRHRDALVLEFTPTENVALRNAADRAGRMAWNALRSATSELVSSFDVRGVDTTAERPVRVLSGGNQQKLVVARELEHGPSLLVVENPTRGLDIRATAAVHDRLKAAAAAGTAVVVYSSDLDEVLLLADRVMVMYAGSLRPTSNDRAEIGRAMLGVAS